MFPPETHAPGIASPLGLPFGSSPFLRQAPNKKSLAEHIHYLWRSIRKRKWKHQNNPPRTVGFPLSVIQGGNSPKGIALGRS